MIKHISLYAIIALALVSCQSNSGSTSSHPRLFVNNSQHKEIVKKIETQDWAKQSFESMRASIEEHVDRHQSDPEWITSRLSMYWKDGERYTQCYLKNQNWDYGEGDAPVPTVRLPGMRTWNKYYNVALEDRTPYNETGDMWGIDRTDPDADPVLVPYKQSGHMVRLNNVEILSMAEKSSYIYWVTKDEKYAKFASDIYYTWLIGTYYMNPIKDPEMSTKGLGGWEPGGICGYYDYEQIHDDLAERGAAIYDYLYDYLHENPNDYLVSIGKGVDEVSTEVLKRFIELGLIRGGNQGNWNVNGYARIMAPILVMESNSEYEDGRGREYYLEYFTGASTKYRTSLPDLVVKYDSITGLWDESPSYSFGTVSSLLDFATMLYPIGVDILKTNPILQKASMAILPWMDQRGNYVVFGDTRGGVVDYTMFERLLTYYTAIGDTENAKQMESVIAKGIRDGVYSRENANWTSIATQVELKDEDIAVKTADMSYSTHHRFLTMKDFSAQEYMMATLYGGRKGSHLTPNGLAATFYAYGYALAPDASGYESYWSKDNQYHQSAVGANTIVPGYTEGDITVNYVYPEIPEGEYTSIGEHDSFYRLADISADEKRRVIAMVRTSDVAGYYLDLFMSDQNDNDYIFHNVGQDLVIQTADGKALKTSPARDLGTKYSNAYSYFTNVEKVNYGEDFIAHWDVTDQIKVDFRFLGVNGRGLYTVDAPYSTLVKNLTPEGVSSSPGVTPTLIIRQNGINGKSSPFVGVYEAHKGSPTVKSIKDVSSSPESFQFEVALVDGKVDVITYSDAKGVTIERK